MFGYGFDRRFLYGVLIALVIFDIMNMSRGDSFYGSILLLLIEITITVKILFATDELTGLIWAAAKMRPSKSTKDMEVSSLKKKYKDTKFAAGCSREVIKQGAEMLGWDLDKLFEKTILAMRECEDEVNDSINMLFN